MAIEASKRLVNARRNRTSALRPRLLLLSINPPLLHQLHQGRQDRQGL